MLAVSHAAAATHLSNAFSENWVAALTGSPHWAAMSVRIGLCGLCILPHAVIVSVT